MNDSGESNLRGLFQGAQRLTGKLDSFASTSDSSYQENLRSAIASFEKCREIAGRVSLFSPNETLEDVASGDLKYFLINSYVGELALKETGVDRERVLRKSQGALDQFLHLLDAYRILSRSNTKLYERFSEDRDGFFLVESKDPTQRRDTKIKRYREEKDLKQKVEYLQQNLNALDGDDTAARELYLALIEQKTHEAFQNLDGISEEFKMIAMKPPTPTPDSRRQELDQRQSNGGRQDGYSERLDPTLSSLYRNGKTGPLLNKDGRPLQPFTLLDSRQRLNDGVFRPGHSLPTMTIDEYLEEEKRRGGIVDGGGEQSTRPKLIDEDDMEATDAETMKAREWDEFVEANPKGSGNTINRG